MYLPKVFEKVVEFPKRSIIVIPFHFGAVRY
jgi:hypothetical protein